MRQLVGLIVIAGLVGLVILLPDPRRPVVSANTASEWIAALGHESADIQAEASRALLRRGRSVIPSLETAIRQTADQSHRVRLFETLEELLISSDPEVADAAESALERLVASEQPQTAIDAQKTLLTHAALRHGRALTEFQRLGGKLWTGRFESGRRRDSSQPSILFGSDWRGTIQDLRFPLRLFPGGLLQIYVTRDARIGDDERRVLIEHPRPLRLLHPDGACMGVFLDEVPRQQQVRVFSVFPDSPAGKAGVQDQDLVVKFAGIVPKRGVDVRLEMIRFRPGDVVEVDILHDNAVRTVMITLGSEYATGSCECFDSPTNGDADPL